MLERKKERNEVRCAMTKIEKDVGGRRNKIQQEGEKEGKKERGREKGRGSEEGARVMNN